MALIRFLFFQCKTAFMLILAASSQTFHSYFPLLNVVHLKSKMLIVVYPLGNVGQELCIRSCHEDLILTRKRHNCSSIGFIQVGLCSGSKLIEQTFHCCSVEEKVENGLLS